MATNRQNRFEMQPGDVKAELSQCSNCRNNVGAYDCLKFKSKPPKYLLNKAKCPSKIPE